MLGCPSPTPRNVHRTQLQKTSRLMVWSPSRRISFGRKNGGRGRQVQPWVDVPSGSLLDWIFGRPWPEESLASSFTAGLVVRGDQNTSVQTKKQRLDSTNCKQGSVDPAAAAKQRGRDATLDLGIKIPLRHLNPVLHMAFKHLWK